MRRYHDIRPVREPAVGAHRIIADVVGPVCELGDFLALGRSIIEPKPGDLLAIMSAGAYGATEASTYNSRPLVPEVLVRSWRMGARAAPRHGRGVDRARPPAGLALNLHAPPSRTGRVP